MSDDVSAYSDDDYVSGEPVADAFDDLHGRGAWPGQDADDAEPEDFEDSVGDLYEELMGE